MDAQTHLKLALQQKLNEQANTSGLMQQRTFELDLARLLLQAQEYLPPEEIRAICKAAGLEDAERITSNHLENARLDVANDLILQAGKDLSQKIQALSETAESGTASTESLKEQLSALFAEMMMLARKMDEFAVSYPPPPLPELPADVVASLPFASLLANPPETNYSSGHFWQDTFLEEFEAALRGEIDD